MWTLVQIEPGEDGKTRQFWLCTGTKYIVGRKDGECDILVDKDRSISRNHAEIRILQDFDIQNKRSKPKVFVVDKSTYGTKLNKQPVSKEEGDAMGENDIIQFGVFKSSFQLLWLDVTICLSKTSAETKERLRKDLSAVGGHTTMHVSNTTHVITDVIHPSSVIVGALALGIPIVSVGWLTALAGRTSTRTPPPPTSTYVPQPARIWSDVILTGDQRKMAGATGLERMFHPNVLRESLLKDFIFVFVEKETLASHHDIVKHARGSVIDATDVNFHDAQARDAFFIRHADHIVIEHPANSPKGDILRSIGFTALDATSIVAAILCADASVFRGVRAPPRNLLQRPPSRQGSAAWDGAGGSSLKRVPSSATTRIDTLDARAAATPEPAGAAERGLLPFLPDKIELDDVASEPATARRPRAASPEFVDLSDEDDAEAVVLGGKRTRDEPAEAGRSVQRRKTGENAELAVDDDEASQWKTAKLKEEMDDGEDEKPNARPPDDDKPAAPKPAAFSIDLQEEARREPSFAPTFTHAALYVGQKRAPLVKSGGFVLNVALPCYAEYPEQPGDAQQRHSKRFKKQEIGGGASIVQLEVYKDAVAPMVELSQLGQGDPDQMIRYDDLISVRPEAVRRRAGGKFSGLLPSGRGSALLHNVDILPPSSRADGLRTAVPPAAASAAPARGRAQAGSKKSAGALKLHKNSAGAIDPFDYPSDDD